MIRHHLKTSDIKIQYYVAHFTYSYSTKFAFLVFSRRTVGSGLEETELVVVELLRGGQRHCGSSQANCFGGVRVLASVRPDIVRQTVRLDSERHQSETIVHQGHIVS